MEWMIELYLTLIGSNDYARINHKSKNLRTLGHFKEAMEV